MTVAEQHMCVCSSRMLHACIAARLVTARPADVSAALGAVPELRSPSAARTFNVELAKLDYDLEAWRRTRGGRCSLALLDRRDGAGWDLAKRLIRRRNALYRGRLDAGGALRHRFLRREL